MSENRRKNCPGCGEALELARAFWCNCCDDFTRPELDQIYECPVCMEDYFAEFHPDGRCPDCGALGVKSSKPVCSRCGLRVEEAEVLLCPKCRRYFPRVTEDPSIGWASRLGVKRPRKCEVCGEEDPKQLGVRLTMFTLDMSGQYLETVHAMCRDCDNSIRFGEMVTIADTRAVKLKGNWEKGDSALKEVEGARRCIGCHGLDQRKVGVYGTVFILDDHIEAWGSEVVICRECYGDLRKEMPELFAKAKRVKARIRTEKPSDVQAESRTGEKDV